MGRKRRWMGVAIAGLVALSPWELSGIGTPDHGISIHPSVAQARSSGGRSRGGSFRSSPSRSSGSGSTTTRSNNSRPSQSLTNRSNNSGNSGTVVVPVPVGPRVYSPSYSHSSSSDDGAWVLGIILLVLLGLGAWGIFRMFMFFMGKGNSSSRELDNEVVTVTKLQVALLAIDADIQADLTELVENADTESPEGLYQELQEAVLLLLRSQHNWSHVLASSETVKSLAEAESQFEKISIEERSKFSAETLSKVGGKTRKRQPAKPDPDEDPAAYIVVTLVIGTANDKPLFTEIRTLEQLKEGLGAISSLQSDYLMVFELLWSPQDSGDSLTYDELLTEYTGMLQL